MSLMLVSNTNIGSNQNMLLCLTTDLISGRSGLKVLPIGSADVPSTLLNLSPVSSNTGYSKFLPFDSMMTTAPSESLPFYQPFRVSDNDIFGKVLEANSEKIMEIKDEDFDESPIKRDTPSPIGQRINTPSSEYSSGIGTASSEVVSGDSSPRPSTASSCISDSDIEVQSLTEPRPIIRPEPIKDLKINYQGRNLLDLHHNMTYQWNFTMAAVPDQSNLKQYFNERSLYHRLGPFGANDELSRQKCCCGFEQVVPKY